eukprot:CAMPEP_0197661124 /NCGR_PEP_ID=MMETSP1338-20131121/51269_1 /TAXON_ID=43686 ORGANISM="Pelagodinium beii, Strain RCC1491" /NCGR_SAMPLE_ID=MMETSP1338 /ASSEMBLY_ACC=CAM_ASM_000754 /LENGTH=707 /DNA_ID=CAMNT_0043238627 /DNA_START=44 /DNA_END=2167 /DNA_ORIENTATION=+
MSLPHEVKTKAENIHDGDMGIVAKWDALKELFQNHHIGRQQTINAREMLVHNKNRKKTGVSAKDMHEKGLIIKNSGASLKQLEGATCFELAVSGAHRMEQILWNQEQATTANGLMAAVTGKEQFIAVTNCHTSGFCKAALTACRSEIASLCDEGGCLCTQTICGNDEIYKKMMYEGWTWYALPSWLDTELPWLADLIQAAHNKPNTAVTLPTELQAALQVLEFLQAGVSEQEACNKSAVQFPHHRRVIGDIGMYCSELAGGSAEMLLFLSSFASKHSKDKRMGESFWQGISSLRFEDNVRKPFLTNALILAQLVSPKVEDGVAQFITKGDMNKLRKSPDCKTAEADLKEAWQASLANNEKQVIFGRFAVRVVTKLLDKVSPFEKEKHESLAVIKAAYKKEMAHGIQDNAASAAAAAQAPKNFSEVADTKYAVAGLGGYKVGDHYQTKASPHCIYRVSSIGSTDIVFNKISLDKDNNEEFTFPHKLLLDKKACPIQKYGGSIPYFVPDRMHFQKLVGNDKDTKQEAVRCQIFVALHSLAGSISETDALALAMNPQQVVVTKGIKKGTLKLVPVTDSISRVCLLKPSSKTASKANTPKGVCIEYEGNSFHISGPAAPAGKDAGSFKCSSVLSPFFWVTTVHSEEEANMKFTEVSHSSSISIKVPVLTNPAALKKDDVLRVCVPAKTTDEFNESAYKKTKVADPKAKAAA